MTYVVYQGETQPPVTGLISVGGAPQPLTGVGVNFRLWRLGVLVLDQPATVVHPDTPSALAAGFNVQYAWTSAAQTSALAGAYEARFVTNPGAVGEQSTPAFPVLVQSQTPGAQPQLGPAQPWTVAGDVQTVVPTLTAGQADEVVDAATEVLYELSGRRFPGETQRVVRPCSSVGCGLWGVPVNMWGAALASANWTGFSWRFGEPWPGMDRCGCSPLPRVRLGRPVVAVDQVKVDGVVLAPTAYQVAERRWLERIDGGNWPACQNLALDDSQPGTFSVAYRFGLEPPASGRLAAFELACQLARAVTNVACALPPGTTQVTRAGITVNRNLMQTLRSGSSGMPLVDAFLAAFAGRRRAAVWSPETTPRPRRVQ